MSINVEALKQMIRVLREVQDDEELRDRFDLESWFSGEAVEDGTDWKDGRLVPACGTTACACGFAGLDPWFNAQGFELRATKDKVLHTTIAHTIAYKDKTHWEAVRAFFGVRQYDAEMLFGEESYRDGARPIDVIQRIESFLKENKHA